MRTAVPPKNKVQRPLGVSVLGGLLTLIGGVMSFVIFLEIIDSLRMFGPSSVFISSPSSLFGFLLFGCSPVLFYSTGVGLFSSQAWAYRSLTTLIPASLVLFFLFLATRVAMRQTGLSDVPFGDLLVLKPGLFFFHIFQSLLLILPLLYYSHRPQVVVFFFRD